ncbi:hypothetical protein BDF19DRAFT_425143 [Syncephalis fuscata]|nr:hypothetical protein BDF19DRAFT_425143 [Syncephalis fuscata]
MTSAPVVAAAYQCVSSGESHVLQVPIAQDKSEGPRQYLQLLQEATEQLRINCNAYLTSLLPSKEIETTTKAGDDDDDDEEEEEEEEDTTSSEASKRTEPAPLTDRAIDPKKPKLA